MIKEEIYNFYKKSRSPPDFDDEICFNKLSNIRR